jgi:hypothetical protein
MVEHWKARSARWAGLAAAATVGVVAATTGIGEAGVRGLTAVPAAQPKATGMSQPNVISPELALVERARGSIALENPTSAIGFYGYDSDGPQLPAPGDLPSATHKVEAGKTEPDKNTYLVLDHQKGADPHYDYGTHFVFQGHEAGPGYVTRINLDADAAHRVTMLASTDTSGAPLPTIDGSTWDPFAKRLLLTAELGNQGGAYQATLDVPSKVENLFGSLGRGGFEGIQNDARGNVIVVEDSGGPTGTVNTHARQPNSFVYRFVPDHPGDLTHGKLQALAVESLAHPGQTIQFHAGAADADILSQDVKDLHTYGKRFRTHFVTIHDTKVDGTASFDANALAKAARATPFKRPENGLFRPGSGFREFVFDETGDTSALTEAGSTFGGFGSVLSLKLDRLGGDTGTLSLVFNGDIDHTGLDNTAFWDRDHVVFVEDRGDTLHTQHNALDSAWVFDLRADYGKPGDHPFRLIAQGRDPSATLDSQFLGITGFNNDGDNELTGMHISNGDPTVQGILGTQIPTPLHDGWRAFFTNQHGDNITDEIVRDRPGGDGFDDH